MPPTGQHAPHLGQRTVPNDTAAAPWAMHPSGALPSGNTMSGLTVGAHHLAPLVSTMQCAPTNMTTAGLCGAHTHASMSEPTGVPDMPRGMPPATLQQPRLGHMQAPSDTTTTSWAMVSAGAPSNVSKTAGTAMHAQQLLAPVTPMHSATTSATKVDLGAAHTAARMPTATPGRTELGATGGVPSPGPIASLATATNLNSNSAAMAQSAQHATGGTQGHNCATTHAMGVQQPRLSDATPDAPGRDRATDYARAFSPAPAGTTGRNSGVAPVRSRDHYTTPVPPKQATGANRTPLGVKVAETSRFTESTGHPRPDRPAAQGPSPGKHNRGDNRRGENRTNGGLRLVDCGCSEKIMCF